MLYIYGVIVNFFGFFRDAIRTEWRHQKTKGKKYPRIIIEA